MNSTGSSLKYLVAHVAVLCAVCYLATIKAPDHYAIGLLTGWFGVFTMERLRNRSSESMAQPFSTPVPVTRTVTPKGPNV